MNSNIFKVCKHYKDIMECDFLDDDDFSRKLVSFYDKLVKGTDFNNPDAVKRIVRLDNTMFNYIEDYNFSKKLKDTIDVSAVISDSFSYFDEFIEYLLSFSVQYENLKENVVVQTRWI